MAPHTYWEVGGRPRPTEPWFVNLWELTGAKSHTTIGGADVKDELCALCREINFDIFGASICQGCYPHHPILREPAKFDGFRGSFFNTIIGLGPVSAVADRQSCPMCRLVLAALQSTDVGLLIKPASEVILNAKSFHDVDRATPGTYQSTGWWEVDLADTLEPGSSNRLLVVPIGAILRTDPESFAATSRTDQAWFRAIQEHQQEPGGLVVPVGRRLPPMANTQLVRSWIAECEAQHGEKCSCSTPGDDTLLRRNVALRLIDVVEGRLVLGETSQRYVALSYVWGSNTPPVLTKSRLPSFQRSGGGLIGSLPRTIADAAQFVASIGERYLWVDSVCIVQDDIQDKLDILPEMDAIYACATIVVVAASGDTANSGLAGAGSTPRTTMQRLEKVGEAWFCNGHLSLMKTVGRSAWRDRGWTFQEAMLARRIVFFTPRQVYWDCQVDTWHEDRYLEFRGRNRISHKENSIWALGLDEEKRVSWNRCRMSVYAHQAQDFGRREFSSPSDKIWAFMGIMRSLKPKFPRGFIWATPREKLDAALAWNQRCSQRCRVTARHTLLAEGRAYGLKIPSWSPLSTRCGFTFVDPCGGRIASRVEWHEPIDQCSPGRGDVADLVVGSQQELPRHSDTGPEQQPSVGETQTPIVFSYDPKITMFGLLNFTAETAILPLRLRRFFAGSWIDIDTGKTSGKPSNERSDEDEDELGQWETKSESVSFSEEQTDANLEENGRSSESAESSAEEAAKSKTRRLWIGDEAVLAQCVQVVARLVFPPGVKSRSEVLLPWRFFYRGCIKHIPVDSSCECVLMSAVTRAEAGPNCIEASRDGSDSGNIEHAVGGCEHVEHYSVMLIERGKDGVASRVALAMVEKEAWESLETTKKRIVLG